MAFTPFKYSHVEPLTVDVDGEKVVVYYRPYGITLAERTEMLPSDLSTRSSAEQQQVLVKLLLKLVRSIDWVDENGEQLGFDEDILRNIPVRILDTLVGQVIDAAFSPTKSGE
ncbi:MAG: hypothetical protein V7641_818 [Blastocatellia bacterium]